MQNIVSCEYFIRVERWISFNEIKHTTMAAKKKAKKAAKKVAKKAKKARR